MGVAAGAAIIAFAAFWPISPGWKDVALVFGGALVGLISIWVEEFALSAPRRAEDNQRMAAISAANERLIAENETLLALAKANEERETRSTFMDR